MNTFSRYITLSALTVILGCCFPEKIEASVTPVCCDASTFHGTRAGNWFTRLRALYILPNSSSGSLSTVADSGVSVLPSWTGEFDIEYMFTQHLSAALILGTSRNTIVGEKALSGVNVGSTWLLPPTLTLKWRFAPCSTFQPYVGAGVNYTLFYSNNCKLNNTTMSLRNSWGPAVQAGCDFFISECWFLNVDVKYIWINTNATLSGDTSGSVHVNINPWVFGIGFGRKW